jgi:hypothetical protein
MKVAYLSTATAIGFLQFVFALADGRITVDAPAAIDSLRVSLKRLAEQKGIVWYYRESGEAKAAIGHFTCNIEEISLGQDFPVR